jgi:hypothetical protein
MPNAQFWRNNMVEVTKKDLAWRKKFHAVTGHVDMDYKLAELIARHRIASTTALQAELAEARARIAVLDKALRGYPAPEDYDNLTNFQMAYFNWRKLANAALAGKETP